MVYVISLTDIILQCLANPTVSLKMTGTHGWLLHVRVLQMYIIALLLLSLVFRGIGVIEFF